MIHIEKRGRLTIFAAVAAMILAASCASAPPQKEVTLTDLVIAGDINAIKKFYANQEQLNMKDGQGLYPLHYAVMRGDAQIAEILIVLQAKVDVRDPAGKTPLRYAIDRKQISMARMLVDRGADPFVADASGSTPAEAALGPRRHDRRRLQRQEHQTLRPGRKDDPPHGADRSSSRRRACSSIWEPPSR